MSTTLLMERWQMDSRAATSHLGGGLALLGGEECGGVPHVVDGALADGFQGGDEPLGGRADLCAGDDAGGEEGAGVGDAVVDGYEGVNGRPGRAWGGGVSGLGFAEPVEGGAG